MCISLFETVMSNTNSTRHSLPRYSHVRFIHMQQLLAADLPLQPVEFEELVKEQCMAAHLTLKNKFVYMMAFSILIQVYNK